MKTLTTALMTKFTEISGGVHNSLYILTSGKLYKERGKQNAVMPYAVYHIISNVPEWNFCSEFECIG